MNCVFLNRTQYTVHTYRYIENAHDLNMALHFRLSFKKILLTFRSDTDTPFDDNSQAVTMAQKYKSQQSTPSVVSNEKYESMHKTPAYNRSKSHPAKVERQQTPEDYEFMEGAKERRMLYSRSESSGYHTGSKGSQQRSTEGAIDEEVNRDNAGTVRPRGSNSGHDQSRESSFEDDTEPKRRMEQAFQLPTVLDSLQSVGNSRASSPSVAVVYKEVSTNIGFSSILKT